MVSISRRAFIGQASLLTAGAMLPIGAPASARSIPWPPGIQLWTVKGELEKDFEGTLRALGQMGYRRVESAGFFGRTARQYRAAVRAAGLDCVSCHFGLGDLIADPDKNIAFARDVGARYVVASSPAPSRPLDQSKPWAEAVAESMTLADWRSNAEAMDRIGARARRMGLRFGYHNHSAELLAYEKRLPLDEIVRLTKPANVVLELDLGWVAGAGYDPVEMINRYRSRIHLLHIKDLASPERTPGKIIKDERTTVIGQGTIEWAPVFRALRRAPVHSYFVEQEDPFTEPPLEAARKSVAYLRNLSI
jgi:sugar phosphate isomerase/epimerase